MDLKIEICQKILETLLSNRLAPRNDTIQDKLVHIAGADENYLTHAQHLARHEVMS